MKGKSTIICFCLILIVRLAGAQCIPPPPTGTPGLQPPTANLPCADTGAFYDVVIFIENFTTFQTQFGNVLINSLALDSLSNLPCGLDWEADRPNPVYATGETGCLRVFGTTTDLPGAYQIQIFVSLTVTVPFLGVQTFSGEASELVRTVEQLLSQPTGVDFDYFIRVKYPTDPCNDISTLPLMCARKSCSDSFVQFRINTNPIACENDTLTLSVSPVCAGLAPYTYLWSPSAGLSNPNLAQPQYFGDQARTYTLSVTDQLGNTNTQSISISLNPKPVASFSAAVLQDPSNPLILTNTSANANSVSWSINAGSNVLTFTNQDSVLLAPENLADTVVVTLVANNACGSDTEVQTFVLVSNRSVALKDAHWDFYPHPSSGFLHLRGLPINGQEIKIVNVTGQVMIQETWKGQILSLKSLNSGVYFIHVLDGDYGVVKKLIVQNP